MSVPAIAQFDRAAVLSGGLLYVEGNLPFLTSINGMCLVTQFVSSGIANWVECMSPVSTTWTSIGVNSTSWTAVPTTTTIWTPSTFGV